MKISDLSLTIGVVLIGGAMIFTQNKSVRERATIDRKLARLEGEYNQKKGTERFIAWKAWGRYIGEHKRDKHVPLSIIESSERWQIGLDQYYPNNPYGAAEKKNARGIDYVLPKHRLEPRLDAP